MQKNPYTRINVPSGSPVKRAAYFLLKIYMSLKSLHFLSKNITVRKNKMAKENKTGLPYNNHEEIIREIIDHNRSSGDNFSIKKIKELPLSSQKQSHRNETSKKDKPKTPPD